MKKIAVIGGGITGLTSAFYLNKWLKEKNSAQIEIEIFEGQHQPGGKIQTATQNGFVIERGADSFLKRKPGAIELVQALGLEDALIENNTGQSYVATSSGIHPIPVGTYMGIPVETEGLLKSHLLSEEGKARALAEVNVPQGPPANDQSLGLFLRRRFGNELVNELLAPLLSGIYSSDVDEMSLQATFPQFYAYEQKYGSILKGLRSNMQLSPTKKKAQFASLRGGLSTMIDRLYHALESKIYLQHSIASIQKNNKGYTLLDQTGRTFEADYIISAIPYNRFQSLFHADEKIKQFDMLHRSVCNIALSFDRSFWKESINGTGFVVSKSSELNITACTWVHKKWLETTPEGKALLRVYLGRANDQAILEQEDHILKEIVLKDLKRTLALDVQPESFLITKWRKQMPQYTIGHVEKVNQMRAYLNQSYPGLYVAGASYDGVGIPDCIQSAKQAAQEIVNHTFKCF